MYALDASLTAYTHMGTYWKYTRSADDSHNKDQLAERSEESEYETISQDEGLGSPTVTPYTIDNDFSLSSHRPSKRTRSHKEPMSSRTIEQPESTISMPGFKNRSQEKVTDERYASHHSAKVAAGPSNTAKSTFSSIPSNHPEGANRQDGQGSSPKFSSLSQNTQASLPNNQQATMSPHARANLSQQMHFPEASDQQQPISSASDSVSQQQQQQQEGGHHHHVHIKVFVLQRRAPGVFAVLVYYLLNVLKIIFFASILYYMFAREMIPLLPFTGREKLYVFKRM
ncbi:hypothetical protein MAM1_0227d08374 [Mucor ambiguus]|uniref:Uncharacterized protein n=1 Tax=Mucor ambiguus TaxID=91626 RepID=A0A0C9MZ32_9FUNG|nr:hypothetical protein MAM1_0227d08374 [Mucor ambiguus]